MEHGGIIFVIEHAALESDCSVVLPEEFKDIIRSGYYLDICSVGEPERRLRPIIAQYSSGKFLAGGLFRDIRGKAIGVYMLERHTFIRVPASVADEARRLFGRSEDLRYE